MKRISPVFFGDPGLRTEIAATIDTDSSSHSSSGSGWDTYIAGPAQYSSSCCWVRNPRINVIKEGMQFFDSVWFVEVQSIKDDSTGNPGVLTVSVVRDQP